MDEVKKILETRLAEEKEKRGTANYLFREYFRGRVEILHELLEELK